jgi:hypothetical protein
VRLRLRHGREEDDRRLLRPRPGADHLRRLEAIHDRHVHVEEDDGEVLLQERSQRLASGVRADEGLAEVAQDRFQRHELVRPVVDEQDADPLVRRRRLQGGVGGRELRFRRRALAHATLRYRRSGSSW